MKSKKYFSISLLDVVGCFSFPRNWLRSMSSSGAWVECWLNNFTIKEWRDPIIFLHFLRQLNFNILYRSVGTLWSKAQLIETDRWRPLLYIGDLLTLHVKAATTLVRLSYVCCILYTYAVYVYCFLSIVILCSVHFTNEAISINLRRVREWYLGKGKRLLTPDFCKWIIHFVSFFDTLQLQRDTKWQISTKICKTNYSNL